ncbi:MAG: dTDP-glucose 4,6-dehydratase [Patescibacteria group bacterium]|jgi:dTDP-glucose 4,6-dehydratase
MNLLITGGAGFIGSNFIHYWLKSHPEDHIVNLDKLTYCGNLENLKSIEASPNYKFVKGDVCDAQLVNKVLQGIDTVVHFAAESHVDRSILEPDAFIKTNILGTHVLLDASLKNNIKRFHHISTDEVFGALPLEDNSKFSESTKYDPRSPYSASKAASDHLVNAYYTTYGLPVTITNTSNNYGPFQYPEKLLPLAITNLIENKKVPIYGDGKYVRDWLYVEDHCRAVELVLEKAKIGETYLIGGLTEDVNNLELIRRVLKIMGKSEEMLEYVKDRPGHDRRYAVDWSKAKNDLGYKPLYDLDTYLEKTIDWYQKNEDWWKRIKSGDYLKYYKTQYEKR